MLKSILFTLAVAVPLAAQSVETIPYRVNLASLNEVPPVAGEPSVGSATVLFHVVKNAQGEVVSGTVDFKVSYRLGQETNITMMHIHRGAAGANGPVVIDSGLPAAIEKTTAGVVRTSGQVAANNATALAALKEALQNPAGFYVNMHTTRSPSGEIRGQLMPAQVSVTLGRMSPDNENPAIADLNASAICSIMAIAALTPEGVPMSAEVIFDANYVGFPADTLLTGFHIHAGQAGVNGPVVINTGLSGQVPVVATGGNLHYEVQIDPMNPAQSAAVYGLFLDPSRLYVNLHTTVNPGGAIRSQLRKTDKMRFQQTLLPSNEIPALALDASAPASLTLYTTRNNDGWITGGVSVFDVNYRFPGATQFTGLHIHTGKATENGAVILNTGLSAANQPNSETGVGNIYRVTTHGTVAMTQAMNLIAADPNATYMNLHTTVNTGGAVRAQTSAPQGAPLISAIISGASDPSRAVVAPQGLMTIFGSNLMSVAAGMDGYESAAPLQLNGTTVTVGGKTAAIMLMGRESGAVPTDFITAQVPVDSATGTLSVVVETAGGKSAGNTATVATVAPALYFDTVGAIAFHMADFTLVRPDNPAVAGEQIGLAATGLGRTIPPVATGQIGSADTLTLVFPSPSVSLNGRPAPVVGAGMAPGYAGLYLVVFMVPEGVSGVVPVTISQLQAGSATPVTSNAVTLSVK
ncbi:MAG: CHRD domain-containing protein [Bryobacterales bacterium]|nr:CHRD domain-containing protein [Bryobacterales bacterium]